MAGPTVVTLEDDGTGPATQAQIDAVNAQNGAISQQQADALNGGSGSDIKPVVASSAVDVIAVLDMTTLKQVFADARPLRVSPNEGGDVMHHPLEDGSQIADHFVLRPTEITYPAVITKNVRQVVDEIRRIGKAGTLLVVQTRGGEYKNMVMFDWPREETAELYNGTTITLKFRFAKFIKPQQGGPVPRAAKHAKTTKRGQVQPTTPAAPRGSFLFRHVPVGGG